VKQPHSRRDIPFRSRAITLNVAMFRKLGESLIPDLCANADVERIDTAGMFIRDDKPVGRRGAALTRLEPGRWGSPPA
jgi:hypothetical protein